MTEHPNQTLVASNTPSCCNSYAMTHDERWSRGELQAELGDVEPSVLRSAVEQLGPQGVAIVQRESSWPRDALATLTS